MNTRKNIAITLGALAGLAISCGILKSAVQNEKINERFLMYGVIEKKINAFEALKYSDAYHSRNKLNVYGSTAAAAIFLGVSLISAYRIFSPNGRII